MNRLGKRYQNENKTGGTAHNGWHTLMSFNDAIDDYDRIPSWQIFDQKGIDGGPMGTQQGGWFEDVYKRQHIHNCIDGTDLTDSPIKSDPFLWVNQEGNRFANEHMEYALSLIHI